MLVTDVSTRLVNSFDPVALMVLDQTLRRYVQVGIA